MYVPFPSRLGIFLQPSVTRFGPVAQYHENSMYYSAVKPEPNPEVDQNLPHITIQMPVYKESLELTMSVFFSSIVFFDNKEADVVQRPVGLFCKKGNANLRTTG